MFWTVIGVLLGLWVLMNLKKSRADGELVQVHPYRQIMPFIMQGRNESIVYYDDFANAEPILAYIQKARERFHCDVTHALVASVGIALAEQPRMNQFVVGRRLYKRKHRQITFSMKRKKLDKKAKLSAVKMELADGETFQELCERINAEINVERSDKKTYLDKELSLFNMVPRPVLNGAVSFLAWLDYHNLLPYGAFIKGDAMYTSTFIANLGSLGMGAAYHHLYEWGNCPLFLMFGKIEDRAVVVGGEVVVRKTMHLRWSYDERIDDGLSSSYGRAAVKRALENPEESLGCLAEDGSDATPMSHKPAD